MLISGAKLSKNPVMAKETEENRKRISVKV
jgi:hypothetical protein